MYDRLISFVVAVSLGSLVWLYARSRDQEMLDHVPVPVEIALPRGQEDDYDLEVPGPSQTMASFTGPPSRIRELRGMLQRRELVVKIVVALPDERRQESRYLDTVRIDASALCAPAGIRANVVEGHNRIPIVLRRLVERRLPVRLDHGQDDRVAQAVIEPASVLVRGPQEVLDRARAIPTQPFSFSPASESDTAEVVSARTAHLVEELEGRPIRTTPSKVSVKATIQPSQKPFELRDVPILFLCPPNFPLKPRWQKNAGERAGKITLLVQGPVSEEKPAVLVYIDLTAGNDFKAGLYEEPIRVQLPKGFVLAQTPPRTAAFELIATGEDKGNLTGRIP